MYMFWPCISTKCRLLHVAAVSVRFQRSIRKRRWWALMMKKRMTLLWRRQNVVSSTVVSQHSFTTGVEHVYPHELENVFSFGDEYIRHITVRLIVCRTCVRVRTCTRYLRVRVRTCAFYDHVRVHCKYVCGYIHVNCTYVYEHILKTVAVWLTDVAGISWTAASQAKKKPGRRRVMRYESCFENWRDLSRALWQKLFRKIVSVLR